MASNFMRILGVGALAATIAVPAAALETRYGGQVEQVNNTVFEVTGRASAANGQEYWCNAAEYARRSLDAGWNDTIKIVRGRATGQVINRKSVVQFSLDPGHDATGIRNINSLQVGESLTVQRADIYCGYYRARL